MIVSYKAKKKKAVCDKRMSYLHIATLKFVNALDKLPLKLSLSYHVHACAYFIEHVDKTRMLYIHAMINVTVHAKTSLVRTKIEINFFTPGYSYIH